MTPNEEDWQKIHDNGLQDRLPPKVWIDWAKDNVNVPGEYCVPAGRKPRGELFDFYWYRISQGRDGDGGYRVPIPLFKIREDMTKEDFDKLYDNWVKVQFSADTPIKIESPPAGCPHDDKTVAVFATSHYWQSMYVEIDMIKWGIEPEIMSFVRPTIKITQLCNARHDCGAQYQMIAYLMRPEEEFPEQLGHFDEIPTEWPRLKEFRKEWADGEGGKDWTKAEIVFDQYPVRCRKLCIKVFGKDTKYWKGEYGAKFGQIEVQVIMPDEIKFKKYEEFADPEKVPDWLPASNPDNANPGVFTMQLHRVERE